MYVDALSFLEDERDAWAPFEALAGLTDEQLEAPTPADGPAHGWSGRDLMAHMAAWQQVAMDAARELAVGETSTTITRVDREWESTGGDAINAAIAAEWRALPLDEVRRRFSTVAGELRGYLTVVPETRWVKNAAHLAFFLADTLDHYEEHQADLAAILEAARAAASRG
jgi:hypothetical protein